MPNFPNPVKLIRQLTEGDKLMTPFRTKRRQTYEFFLGRWYGDGVREKHPVNLVSQFHDAYLALLAGGPVEAVVEPNRADLVGESTVLGLVLGHLYKDLDYADTRRRAIQDALLGPMAILKYGRRAGDELLKVDDRYVNLGSPYVTLVDLDDYGIDPQCLWRRNARWEFHRYTMARYAAADFFGRDEGEIDPELAAFIMTREEAREFVEGMPGVQDASPRGARRRLADLWKQRGGDQRWDSGDDVRFTDVALYMDDGSTWIVTLPADPEQAGAKFLAAVEWDGPEPTPYEALSFSFVNSNPIGVSPSSKFMDLAEASDLVANKVIRQILRTKRIFPAKRSAAEDIATIAKSPDGDFPLVNDPRDIHAGLDIGGVPKDLASGLTWLDAVFNQLSGNTQLLQGMGTPGADTATENQILQGNAQVRLRAMATQVERMDDRTARHLGWYVTTDPLYASPPMPYRMPGGEIVTLTYTSETRSGGPMDFNFRFRHRTVDSSDPAVRQQRFIQVITLLPQLAQMAVMGIIQWEPTLKVLERRFDFDDLSQIVGDPTRMMAHAQLAQGMPPMEPGVPSGTAGGPRNALPPGGGDPARSRPALGAAATKGAY